MTSTELYTIDERKTNGIFYTPKFLSDYLSKKIIYYLTNKEEISLLDPACGDSMLLDSFINQAKTTSITLKNIVGIDKDLVAIENSKKFKEANSRIDIKLINTDSLFPLNANSSDQGWKSVLNKYNNKKKFDVILSNPPWGSNLKEYDSVILNDNFSLAKGQFDIYALFTELIIRNLSDKGCFGLIIPDSIFNQEQTSLRKFLISETSILFIARLGEKIFPEINRACVIIIGRNQKASDNHTIDCMRLSANLRKKLLSNELSLHNIENEILHSVLQKRFLNNENYIFDIDLKVNEEKTLEKLEKNSIPLKKIVTNTRGAEISKKGVACQCPLCGKWMPHPKTENFQCNHCKENLNISQAVTEKIIHNDKRKGSVKLKVGEDLYRYTSQCKSQINILKDGINYKNPEIYHGDKILVRKTGIGITASIDYEESYTNQVVYILKVKPEYDKYISLEFVLSILNSRVITYYLIKKYGENEWRTHPYLTQTMLINLPFPNIDLTSNEINIRINEITTLIKNEVTNSNDKNISKEVDITIERFVASLFKLDENDYKEIFNSLYTAEPLIPIKRLKNCTIKDIFTSNGI